MDQATRIAASEEFRKRENWFPHLKSGVLPSSTLLKELISRPGGYNNPLHLREKFTLVLQQRVQQLYGTKDSVVLDDLSQPTPLRWGQVVRSLHEWGVIRQPVIDFEMPFNDEPKTYMVRLRAKLPIGLTDGGTDLEGGGYSRGMGRDLERAISKAVGELLERYPLTIYRDADLLRASIDNLEKRGLQFLNPSLVSSFSEEQKREFPNRRFDKESVFRWVVGKSLMTGGNALIPAQLVFWNYLLASGEPLIQQPITNGAGGMFSLEGAILRGLYELIERDGFLIYWLNGIAPPRINSDSFKTSELQGLISDIKRYRLRLETLDITSDFDIPAFAAILLDESGKGPAFSLGGGCGWDAEVAITGAVYEALNVRHWLRFFTDDYPLLPERYKPFTAPKRRRDRLLLWANSALRESADFFLQGPCISLSDRRGQSRLFSGEKEELMHVLNLFKNRGKEFEVFYFEAHHSILDKLGYHAVSVSVPALLPLYLNETCAPLGAQRIRTGAAALGGTYHSINSLPHPFP